MSQPRQTLEQIFEKQVQTLALTLQPFTVVKYQYVARYFVGYLRETFPEVRRLSQLRRDPHMLGWFRWLCELRPPVGNHTREQRLLCLRRLLDDLAFQGHPVQPGLILREDFPARPQYLPRAMSPEDDRRLQEELRRADSMYSNALLLTRVTGIRIGECIHLPLDCRRQVGPEQWALHVPLGKLHTERLVPLDSEGLRLIERILELRALAPPGRLAKSKGFLLPRVGGRFALFQTLREAMADFAKRAGCADSSPLSPHRLRHTWATEMLLCGMSLPALMQLMGHKDIRMTLRYLRSPSRTCSASSIRLARTQPRPITFPHSPSRQRPPTSPGYVTHSRPHAIFWKCIDASSPMTRPVAAYSVSIDGSWMSINNFRT